MRYDFDVYQMQVEDHLFWVAKSKKLKGCVGQGDSVSEAISELEANELEWLASAEKYNIPIPSENVQTEKTYSGKFVVRTSPFVHEAAARTANAQSISMNQFVNNAILYYVAVVSTPQSRRRSASLETVMEMHQEQRPSNVSYIYAGNQEKKEM